MIGSSKLRVVAVVVLISFLSGCTTSSVGSYAGAIAGVTSGTFTANPAVGYAVGIGTQAAVDASVKYVLREWKNDQQNIMANKVGAAAIGDVIEWEIKRSVPIANEKGSVQVVRDIPNALVPCREVLFITETKEGRSGYMASICQHSGGSWRWATAEPAIARWGGLQ